jgi:hypothetical protein
MPSTTDQDHESWLPARSLARPDLLDVFNELQDQMAGFVDGYRTKCTAPKAAFRLALEAVAQLKPAARL